MCPPLHRSHWSLVREQSVFCDWQRLKVQEAVEEVSTAPRGAQAH